MGNSADKHNHSSPDPGAEDDGSGNTPPSDSAAWSPVANANYHPAAGQGAAQPQTRCANCQTVFEVSPELLVSNDTRVRCGECLSIFDALINLRRDIFASQDDSTHHSQGGNPVGAEFRTRHAADGLTGGVRPVSEEMQENGSTLDVTYSDFDLFSGEAALPDVAYFDQTQDLDGLRFDEPDGDETFSDELFAHDMTIEAPEDGKTASGKQSPALEPTALDAKVDFVTDDVQSDPVVFTYRDPDGTQDESADTSYGINEATLQPLDEIEPSGSVKSGGSRTWLVRLFLTTLIIVIAAGLYAYRSRDSLLQNPEVRPWIAKTCAWIGCELTPLVDLAALKQLKRTVFSHPTNENQLVIDLAFMNEATFDQPYPILQIRLTNRTGALVVQNNVTPAEYLDDWQPEDLLAAGERIDLSLTFEDPGRTATYAELQFLQ